MVFESYKKAGSIASECKKLGLELVKEGAKHLDVAEKIEAFIFEKGGRPAFPVNISINEVAAHDIPDHEDVRVFNNGDVVKLDIGVHVDGYIADTALTIIIGENRVGQKMKETNEAAVEAAIAKFAIGVSISEISEAIEKTIRDAGFQPIVNLTGHRVSQFVTHDHPSIPNVKTGEPYRLKEGDAFAVEPFLTVGKGYVNELHEPKIYRFLEFKPVRFPEGRKILETAKTKYDAQPFAKRWLIRDLKISTFKLNMILRQLVQIGALYEYPPLREVSGALVTQTEQTIYMAKDGPVVITR